MSARSWPTRNPATEQCIICSGEGSRKGKCARGCREGWMYFCDFCAHEGCKFCRSDLKDECEASIPSNSPPDSSLPDSSASWVATFGSSVPPNPDSLETPPSWSPSPQKGHHGAGGGGGGFGGGGASGSGSDPFGGSSGGPGGGGSSYGGSSSSGMCISDRLAGLRGGGGSGTGAAVRASFGANDTQGAVSAADARRNDVLTCATPTRAVRKRSFECSPAPTEIDSESSQGTRQGGSPAKAGALDIVEHTPKKSRIHDAPAMRPPKSFEEIWPILAGQGWKMELGKHGSSSSQKYYVPPGVQRGKARRRIDYFDSKVAVVKHFLSTSAQRD